MIWLPSYYTVFQNIIEVENDPLDGFDEILKESIIQKSIHQVHTDMKLALENPVSHLDYPKILKKDRVCKFLKILRSNRLGSNY